MTNLLFWLAVSGLLAHELDAMDKHEWRLLFILRGMPDATAQGTFVVVHVPLITMLLWLATYPNQRVHVWTLRALDLFMIIHAGLHWRISEHPRYEFHPLSSRLLIFGTAGIAAAHLMLERRASA